jgi:hypothetical protein
MGIQFQVWREGIWFCENVHKVKHSAETSTALLWANKIAIVILFKIGTSACTEHNTSYMCRTQHELHVPKQDELQNRTERLK